MSVKSDASICVYLDAEKATVRDVRDWLAEVNRLNIPDSAPLDECVLSLYHHSQVLESVLTESSLGVEGWDILVGLSRV
jgi:hypothetical protein